MCPHTTACVLILLYMCPHTTGAPPAAVTLSRVWQEPGAVA
jgi:hypothetical protein